LFGGALPLGMLVDLSGQAKYFFVPFKGTSRTKPTTTTKQQHKYKIFKNMEKK